MDKRFIAFRLRKDLDDDLYVAIKDFDSLRISDIARTGMRLALGITTQKVAEVKEIPVTRAVWRPKQK